MLVATTVIATIRVAITSVRAAISLVMPPRRGAEAMNHAAASSTEPRVLATLTIVISCARPRPRPRSRAGSTFAATSTKASLVLAIGPDAYADRMHDTYLDRLSAMVRPPRAPAAAPTRVVSLLLPICLPASPPANAPPTVAARPFSRKSMPSNLSRTFVMRERSRRPSWWEREGESADLALCRSSRRAWALPWRLCGWS